jgi:two-component sensor histidine kinase
MQVIRAMLILKAESHQNAEITAFAQEIEQKILAMALVHQKLYQSQDLSQVDLSEYLKELAHLIIQSYSVVSPRITLKLELDQVPVLIDTAIPCGLLVNELMSNALKHAFPEERAGEISIKLWRTFAGIIELSFADNGVGLPEGFDIREQPTLGLQTIVGLAEQQLQGEIHYDGQHGLAYVIRFHDNFYTPRVST